MLSKELQDLESLLTEYVVSNADNSKADSSSVPVPATAVESVPVDDAKAKKNKKKKAVKKEVAAAVEVTSEVQPDTVTVGDVSSILKMRAKKSSGKSASSGGISDAQRIAMSEALKAAGGKKKKDKSKFNETSY